MRAGTCVAIGLAGLVWAIPARADVAAAEAAFLEAKRLYVAHDYAAACPKLELSYKEDPQLGTLLFLADCHQHAGQLASAWAEFRQAAEMASARSDRRAAFARDSASKLEPRVPHLVIHRPRQAPAGLAVTLDGRDVTAMVDAPLPVDFGAHEVASTLAGKPSAPQRIDITREGATVEITTEVPADAALVAPDAPPPSHRLRRAVPIDHPFHDGGASHRRATALWTGGAGLAVASVGLYFGAKAYSSWHDSRAFCDANDVCQPRGRTLVDDANSAAWKADVLVGVGAATIAVGAYLWVTAPRERVVVVPAVSAHEAGATFAFRF